MLCQDSRPWTECGLSDSFHITPNSVLIKIFVTFEASLNIIYIPVKKYLTLNLLMTTIVAPPSNVSKWQMGINSALNKEEER